MARIVVRNALFFGRRLKSMLMIPHCTYTNPEIAHIGKYEWELNAAAAADGRTDFDVYKQPFTDNDRAICDGQTDGFVKILTKKNSDVILGCTIVAENAGDLICEIAVCMGCEISLGKLSDVIHPYPTVAEAIKKCADAFNKTRLTPTARVLMRKILAAKR